MGLLQGPESGLDYKWTISLNDVIDTALVSSSKDPSKLMLPAYSLQTGMLYDVSLSVTMLSSLKSSRTFAQVYVQPGSVVAVVTGGLERSLRFKSSLLIDASSSYDEEVRDVVGVDAGLSFSWSCMQISPSFSSTCDATLSVTAMSPTAISVSADRSVEFLATTNEFTITLWDAAAVRSSSVYVVVRVVPSISAVVQVTSTSTTSAGVLNADEQLVLLGTVSLPSGMAGALAWTVDNEGDPQLSTTALTPLSYNFAASSAAASSDQMFSVYLVVAAHKLSPGVVLSFTLSCVGTTAVDNSQQLSSSSITITVNIPPQPGIFYLSPSDGTELQDPFVFIASQWQDADIPIKYQFGYTSRLGAAVIVLSKSEATYGSSILPAGLDSAGNALSCFVTVFDSLSASNDAVFEVTVRKGAVFSVDHISQYIDGIVASGSGSVDGMKQATSLSSYLLNQADCSGVTVQECASLHRASCASVANTCGPCLSDFFSIAQGDSNDPCVAVASSVSLAAAASVPCSDSLECTTEFQSCVSGMCVYPDKTCVADCSGLGECMFVSVGTSSSTEQELLQECALLDSSCVASCFCEVEYSGSFICSASTEEVEFKQTMRSQVIDSLRSLLEMEDASKEAVSGWVSTLYASAGVADELSHNTSMSVLTTSAAILETAALQKLSSDTVSDIVNTVDSTLQFVSNSISQRTRRR